LLYEVADAYARTADDAAKTANAQALLGKTGADLIPLLNGGAKSLREYGDEAARLGVVFDQDAARAAEAFNDNLTRLKITAQGAFAKIASDLAPQLEQLTSKIADPAFQSAVSNVVTQTVDMTNALVRAAPELFRIFAAFRGAALGFAAGTPFGPVGQFIGTFAGATAGTFSPELIGAGARAVAAPRVSPLSDNDRVAQMTGLSLSINAVQGRINSGAAFREGSLASDAKALEQLRLQYDALAGAVERAAPVLAKPSIGFSTSAAAANDSRVAVAALGEEERRYFLQQIEQEGEQLRRDREMQQAFQQMTQREFSLQGLGGEDRARFTALMDAEDQLNTQLEAIETFYKDKRGLEDEANAASLAALMAYRAQEQQINQASAKVNEKIDYESKVQLQLQALSFAGTAIATLKQFAGENKRTRLALLAFEKAIAIAEIIINTQVAAAKAVGQMGPFGIPAAAFIQGLGAAQVALVTATGVAEAAQINGGRATGGAVGPDGVYRVNESGTELLRTGGKDYLLTGNNGGTVMSASAANDTALQITVVNETGVPVRGEAEQQPDGRVLLRLVKAEMTRDLQNRGEFSQAMEGTYANLARRGR
jgi:hypothetical protein